MSSSAPLFTRQLQRFLKMEASAGILLVMAAALALIVANSPLYVFYDALLNKTYFTLGFTPPDGTGLLHINKPLLLWINDGLMAVFFFLVGLEIKREILAGELSSRERALFPLIAAIGGIAMPALIFMTIAQDHPDLHRGWAIPAATDIAFTLGVIAVLGARVPVALKVLVTAIAIIDDLGAIIIIAAFYTDHVALGSLMVAGIAFAGLLALNLRGVTKITPYMLIGFVMWFAVLKSGVHATLAGVALAVLIPMKDAKNPSFSPLKHLEHTLHPWVAYMILPIFGFANAGLSFEGMTLGNLLDPLVMGIAMGLFLGKQIGIFAAFVLAHVSGLARKPASLTWLQLYAASILCGIGFTMSLFIGSLAFDSAFYQAEVRLGVLLGSVASAILGYVVLRLATQGARPVSS